MKTKTCRKLLSLLLSVCMLAALFTCLCGLKVSADKTPRIEVGSKEAIAGETVSIEIKLVNNPGIACITLRVYFPSDLILNLPVNYNITSVGGQATQPSNLTSPVILNWVSPFANVNGDVVFATLNFTVADEAGLGDKEISVTYNQEDVFNLDEDDVVFTPVAGKITVIPCPHESTTYVPAVASTCKTSGHAGYTVCDKCGAVTEGSNAALPFDPQTHAGATAVRNSAEATCTEAGYTGDTYCLDCGAKIADGEVIAALGHNVGEWMFDENSHHRHCAACGEDVDAGEHDFRWVVVTPATTEADGLKKEICSVCGYESGNTEIISRPVSCPHDDTAAYPEVASTCVTRGHGAYTVCNKCGVVLSGNGALLPLDPQTHEGETELRNVKAPTCTKAGYTGDTVCKACRATVEAGETIAALGHKPTDWIIDKPATLTENGSKHIECSVCGEILETAEIIDQSTPRIAVDSKVTTPGETVNIAIKLVNNPGIASMLLNVSYPSDLTLNSPINFNITSFNGQARQPSKLTSPVVLNWISPFANVNGDVVFATLNFTVADNAEPGDKEISVTYDQANVYNYDLEDVAFAIENGKITVVSCLHEETTEYPAVASTCTTAGHAAYTKCDICGEVIEGSDALLPLDPENHEGETEIINAKAASCTAGYTGDTVCKACGAVLAYGSYIDPTGIHINTEVRGAVAANCSHGGYTGDTYCADCGLLLFVGENTEPNDEHVPGEWVTDGSIHCRKCTECGTWYDVGEHSGGTATCHSKAVCSVCGKEYGELDPGNHAGGTEIRNAKAASCEEAGYTGDTYCLGCGAKLVDGEEIAALGHNPTDWIIDRPATSYQNGSKHKECSRCGITLETEEIPSTDSTPRITVESKTATPGNTVSIRIKLVNNPGLASMKLKVTFPSDLILNSPVNYNITSVGGQATQPQTFTSPVTLNWFNGGANTNGDIVYATLNFTVSDEATEGDKDITISYKQDDVYNIAEEDVVFDITNGKITVVSCLHENTTQVAAVASTCITAGHGTYTVCNGCGAIVSGDSTPLPLDPNNHVNTEIRNAKAATCTEAGYTGDIYCLDCGAKIEEGEAIEALGHKYAGVITLPTCTEGGYITYTCTICGDSYVADYTAAFGHTGGTATCHSKAVCTRCHEEYGEFDPNNHDGETEVRDAKDATCTAGGYSGDTYCLGCGAKIAEGEVIAALGHKPTGWIIDKYATLTEKGSKHTECLLCGELLETAEIPVIDPSAPRIEVESKIAGVGRTVDVKISLINNPGITTAKINVNYAEGLTLKKVTFGDLGGQAITSESLGSPVTLNWFNGLEDMDTPDVTFVTLTFEVAKDAEPGAMDITVDYDPEDISDVNGENVDFALLSGKIETVAYIPGDINGDGTVNNKDLSRLFQYLSDWDVEVNEPALDVNGDGTVNNKDLSRLFQYLSDWDVEIF